jgi:hypothetical protein
MNLQTQFTVFGHEVRLQPLDLFAGFWGGIQQEKPVHAPGKFLLDELGDANIPDLPLTLHVCGGRLGLTRHLKLHQVFRDEHLARKVFLYLLGPKRVIAVPLVRQVR